ncbi:hypothetical protein NEMBOFW57_006012 [Staphylotrichum longicolle]|uniref:Protein kinase domain-containing protein n=1 Tax=Staphylotrichum longicolle TaxID=669026 RepID=A0AAD4HZ21_9PEZI|nr:hypothetical protein NEMBOFW57_006012 [Staphylotrichum longicolle]
MDAHSTKPTILSLQDLDAVVETRNPETGAFEYITFYTFANNDAAYFGQLPKARDEASMQDFSDALELVPEHHIFPLLPLDTELTIAPEVREEDGFFIKRPNMAMYELFVDQESDDMDGFLARLLLSEARIMQRLSQHPHPHIVRYHGVRARRGRITGLVMDKHQITLLEHVRQGRDIEQVGFMRAMESAVAHLHSLGLAHNDINPENIMVGPDSLPVLIDFGSCQPFGKRLMTSGTPGWVESDDTHSRLEHDAFALGKLREWFKKPWFEAPGGVDKEGDVDTDKGGVVGTDKAIDEQESFEKSGVVDTDKAIDQQKSVEKGGEVDGESEK